MEDVRKRCVEMSKNRPLTKKNYLLKIPFQLTISLTNLNKKKEICTVCVQNII